MPNQMPRKNEQFSLPKIKAVHGHNNDKTFLFIQQHYVIHLHGNLISLGFLIIRDVR